MSLSNSMITLSEKAKNYLISRCNSVGASHVLLQAKGGGCAGYKYDWSYIQKEDLNKSDTCISLNENTFLVLDSYSSFKLIGMNIDYVESISGSSLEITNPNAKSTCGCGESFS